MTKHAIGNRYTRYGGEYILALVNNTQVALIGLLTGNRWIDAVEINDIYDITAEEFLKICDGDSFDFLWRPQ